jgi:O-antigen/teichoic acid export membrane protein
MGAFARFRWFLTPTIIQALAALAMLPLVTIVLGPAEYGAFALVTSVTALGSTIAALGSSYVLAEAFGQQDEQRRRATVAGLTVATGSLAVVCAAVLIVLHRYLAPYFAPLAEVSAGAILMASGSMIGLAFWGIASDVATQEGRAKPFAYTSIAQTFVAATVTLWALYEAELGGLALFAGQFAGSLVLFLGGMFVLRSYWTTQGFAWLRSGGLRGSMWPTTSNLLENAYVALERNLLAVFASVHQVGLYSHSQQYRGAIGAGVKAIARAVWPVTLSEAGTAAAGFTRTGDTWRAAHLLLALAGTIFAAIGAEIIHLLTNGKFTQAWPFAALGIAYLLVQSSGKSQTGYMLARGMGVRYARFHATSIVAAAALACLSIAWLGMWGAFAALFFQQVAFRVAIQVHLANKLHIPFQDHVVVIGCLLIMALVGTNLIFELTVYARAAEALIVFGVLAVPLRKAFSALRVFNRQPA